MLKALGISKDDAPVKKDDKESIPKSVGTYKAMMSGVRARATKVIKAHSDRKMNGGRGDVYHIPITFATDLTTNSSGVAIGFWSGAVLAGTSDFGHLSNLFDLVSTPKISFHYEPRGFSAALGGTSANLIHQPQMFCGDDDVVAAIAFTTLVQRDMLDPRNHFGHTGKPMRGHFVMKHAFNIVSSTPTSAKPTLPQWMDTAVVTNCGGGLLQSIRTDATNVSVTLGTLQVCFHCEWSTQL